MQGKKEDGASSSMAGVRKRPRSDGRGATVFDENDFEPRDRIGIPVSYPGSSRGGMRECTQSAKEPRERTSEGDTDGRSASLVALADIAAISADTPSFSFADNGNGGKQPEKDATAICSHPPSGGQRGLSSPRPRTRDEQSSSIPKRAARAPGPSLVWYRGHDLRVEDHPALLAAAQRGSPIIALHVVDKDAASEYGFSEARAWWLRESLKSLEEDLSRIAIRLVLREAVDVLEEVRCVIRETEVSAVYWNRCYDPRILRRDESFRAELLREGIIGESFKAELLAEPWELKHHSGSSFDTFYPYMRLWLALPPPPQPFPPPSAVMPFEGSLNSASLDELSCRCSDNKRSSLSAAWRPGTRGAVDALERFLEHAFPSFGEGRSRLDLDGTSRLSPFLRFGELSPRRLYHAVRLKVATWENWTPDARYSTSQSARAFLKNLCLRDFANHVYFYHPNIVSVPLVREFSSFPWHRDPEAFDRWRKGQTGYPMVDAAMRQLRAEGWIHNALRFLLASFLTKYLLLPFKDGFAEFQKLLVDGDVPANALGWQWTVGCNSDGFPFSCLVNPVGIGKRQDPTGFFIKKWVPELASLEDAMIHSPWRASPELLARARVELGKSYPNPVVDASFARVRVRNAMRTLKQSFIRSSNTMAAQVPRSVTDLIEEWPDEDPNSSMNAEESDTISKLGLFPALWQLLHYDQPPTVQGVTEGVAVGGGTAPTAEPDDAHDANSASGNPLGHDFVSGPGDATTYPSSAGNDRKPPTAGMMGPHFQTGIRPPHSSLFSSPEVEVQRFGRPTRTQPQIVDPITATNYSSTMVSLLQGGTVPGQQTFDPVSFYVPFMAGHSPYPGHRGHFMVPPPQAPTYIPSVSVGASLAPTTRYVAGEVTALPILQPSEGQQVGVVSREQSNAAHTRPPPRSEEVPVQRVLSGSGGVVAREHGKVSMQIRPKPKSKPTPASQDSPGTSTKRVSNEKKPNDAMEDGPTNVAARMKLLQRFSQDRDHEYFSFVNYLLKTFQLTEFTDRTTSNDYVRLCKLKEDFQKRYSSEKDKMQIYKIKAFFKNVLKLEVTGEWDRHYHGGIRGPYVYGIRPNEPEIFEPGK